MEARAVASAVIERALAQVGAPRHERGTPGVAAFSKAQIDAIQDEVELMRKAHPKLEEFFSYQTTEPFFIQNLDTGETSTGYLSMGFG